MHGRFIPALAATDVGSYLPVFIVILMAVGFAVANIVLTRLLGPSRLGHTKGGTYESGMNPVGTARKRFNVRFYLIAVVFLVFDVEIIFLYPWAVELRSLGAFGFFEVLFFVAILLVGLIYAWERGALDWD